MNKCCTKVKHLDLIKSTKLSESANLGVFGGKIRLNLDE